MKKSVFIFGESGRMGQEVKKIVQESENLEYLGGLTRKNPNPELAKSPDIVIDFSLPESLPVLCEFIETHRACLVSGTTGFSTDQFETLKALGLKSPVFWSANMSFGVYLMGQLTEVLSRYQKFYEFQIEETHHIHKKDKPSGTALLIEQAARKHASNLKPIISHRKGEISGIHSFSATSSNEKLEIRHEAFKRSLFAQGAVEISLWLRDKKPGFYKMDDFFQTFASQA